MVRDNLFGDFVRARRARMRPQDVGLPSYGRRRVDGLRRDELARLAGVSVQYLTRLEQGVDRHPSAQVVDALAGALRLDPDAAAHLRALADPAPARRRPGDASEWPGDASARRGPGDASGRRGPGEVAADVRQLLDSWSGTPAYVRDRRFYVLASNKAAMALAPMYHPGRNLVRDVFLEPGTRRLFPDWQEIAEQTVAAWRAAADPRDPDSAALLAELRRHDDFRSLWDRYDVRPSRNEMKRFEHPDVGPLTLRRQTLVIAGAEDQVIIVYQPQPGSPSADALARLL